MESTRDRVVVKTFPSAMPERAVYTLYALESVVRQRLLEDIMSHSLADEHPTITLQPQGCSNSRDWIIDGNTFRPNLIAFLILL